MAVGSPLRVLRGEQADAVERETPPACRRSEELANHCRGKSQGSVGDKELPPMIEDRDWRQSTGSHYQEARGLAS
jgi:hypothetical protein